MKTMNKIAFASLLMTVTAMASYFDYFATATTYPTPENPATGIWIQQVGDIIPQAASNATLYYTKYEESDRVKSISYQYDGAGYLLMKPSDKKTLCTTSDGIEGADGIVHHPDDEHLLVAGQGNRIFKVRKVTASGQSCKVGNKSVAANNENGDFYYHLMNDPNNKYLWASGIPGYLFRFSTEMDASTGSNFAPYGYKVTIKPDGKGYRSDKKLTTLIWDGKGQAYFTYSGYAGGGCEYNCTSAQRKANSAEAYFGYITDTTWTKVTSSNKSTIGGQVGDSVITALGTHILIDSLEGCHGGTYDPYSGTIFVFGGSKIVQIEPFTNSSGKPDARVVATIDLREFFFDDYGFGSPRTPSVGWRLDQGTTDKLGHLFVASNTGHVVFVDFAGNRDKRIDNNVLVHVQWVDNYLDDLAPLTGVGVKRSGASSDSLVVESSSSVGSSSMVVYSSAMSSSSSKITSSSSSNKGSSGNDGSSSSNGSSSSGTGDSSSSGGIGSSGDNGSSSSGNNSSSSGTGDDSSSSGTGDSSSSGGNGSSGSEGDSSSSTGDDSSSSGIDGDSSADDGDGEDEGPSSSSKNLYYGADDEDDDDDDGFNGYPSADAFEKGDSIVSGTVLVPTTPDDDNPNAVVIGGNKYILTDTPTGEDMDLHYNSGKDTAWVGNVVAITLDADKVKEYFGDTDSLKVSADGKLELVDSKDGSTQPSIFVHTDGSITILVTAEEEVRAGTIKVYGNNHVVIIDNINFYDPIPDAYIGYIKDTDGNKMLDYAEVLLKDTVPETYDVDAVRIVVGKDTLTCSKFELNSSKDRVLIDVSKLEETLPAVGEFPADAKVLVTYKEQKDNGVTFVRETNLVEVGSDVIKDAFAIRDTNGLDSLFIQFNIDLIPADVSGPEMLVLLKQAVASCKEKFDDADRCAFNLDQVKKVYMPAKDIVILVGKNMGLLGDMKDSVSLYPERTFTNLQYITSDEYEREVPVTVVDRFPSILNVEYWDTDGDGTLDQIVSVFDRKLTSEELESTLYLTFPWYSSRGMMTYLQADPSALTVDPEDSTRIIWNVTSTSPLAKGLTSISDKLPEATAYTYYKIFGETFVSEASAPLVDKMSPIVADATLNYGKKADTLVVTFSEPIMTADLKNDARDCFSYIHGEETIELNPIAVDWSKDGLTAKLILDGSDVTILPGDSLVVKRGKKDVVKDNYENIAGEHPQAVIIGGLLNHLVESTQMGYFNANDQTIVDTDTTGKTYTLQTVSSVNLRFVPGTTTKEDMEKEGALGHLVQLGERFVPQLLDRAQVSADGSYDPSALDSLKPEDVYISFIVNYTDHLGQYVNDTIISVPCNSPKFGGNCLSTDKKVFVNWNFKDHQGRFVGSGVYTVQFKMIVRYENKKIEEELKDKWGVRRKKHHKK